MFYTSKDGRRNAFPGVVEPERLRFELWSQGYYYYWGSPSSSFPSVFEQLTGSTYFEMFGSVVLTGSSSRRAGTLNGTLETRRGAAPIRTDRLVHIERPSLRVDAMSARLRTWSLLLVAGALLAGFWWRERPSRPLNVVIITLDTTRADRLPAYGFMGTSMPALERLAREGVVFDQATSVAPLTLAGAHEPVHRAVPTGTRRPRQYGRSVGRPPHDARRDPARQRLQTGAFVGSIVLGPERGLAPWVRPLRGVGVRPARLTCRGPAGCSGRRALPPAAS